MRRLLFSLTFILIWFNTVRAQNIQYGMRAALGFATQSMDNATILSTNSVTTYSLSAYVDIPFKRFYIQPGLSLVGKGVKQYQEAQTNTITLTYLDIPVTAIYKFDLRTLGKVYVGAGPYASVGLSGNNQIESVALISGSDVKFGNDEDYRKIDFGINFATGLELNNHLTFNMRYSLGLNNIASDADLDAKSVKNRIFTIGLGFWL
jgi:hypothetical protein